MSQVALDVVELQQLFDQAFDQECLQVAPFLNGQSEIEQLVSQAISPRRMFVGKQELNCNLRVEQEKKLGFELGFNTIPLSFEMLFEKKSLHKQNITINIEQIPLAKHPFSNLDKDT